MKTVKRFFQSIVFVVLIAAMVLGSVLTLGKDISSGDWTSIRDAMSKGITNGTHNFTFLGQQVTVVTTKGTVETAWGPIKYTFEQLLILLN